MSRRNSEVSSSGVTEDASIDTTDSPKDGLLTPETSRRSIHAELEDHSIQPDENSNLASSASELKDTIIKLEGTPRPSKDTEKWVQSIRVHITAPDDEEDLPPKSQKSSLEDEGFPQDDQPMRADS